MKIVLFILLGILILFALFAVITLVALCRLSSKISREEEQARFKYYKKETTYEL